MKIVELTWIKTDFNTSDVLTKQLPQAAFKTHLKGLGMEDANVSDKEFHNSEAEVEADLTPPADDEKTRK